MKSDAEKITIIIDDVLGYPVSFTDAAFGGLVKIDHYDKDELLKRFNIVFHAPHYEPYKQDMIEAIKNAASE